MCTAWKLQGPPWRPCPPPFTAAHLGQQEEQGQGVWGAFPAPPQQRPQQVAGSPPPVPGAQRPQLWKGPFQLTQPGPRLVPQVTEGLCSCLLRRHLPGNSPPEPRRGSRVRAQLLTAHACQAGACALPHRGAPQAPLLAGQEKHRETGALETVSRQQSRELPSLISCLSYAISPHLLFKNSQLGTLEFPILLPVPSLPLSGTLLCPRSLLKGQPCPEPRGPGRSLPTEQTRVGT